MFKTIIGAWWLLLALLPAPSFAADIHSVFTSWSSAFGREKTAKTEIWTRTDKECRISPKEILIIRKDLCLIWKMRPNAKTYSESPWQSGGSPAPAGNKQEKAERPPAGESGKPEDLRTTGFFDEEPTLEWSTRLLGDEEILGQPCKIYFLRGDADFASVSIKIWISPDGGKRGLAAPDTLLSSALNRDEVAAEAVAKVLAGFPDGGLVRLERTTSPPLGGESKGRITLDVYETKEPPAGIYEIPAGVEKEGDKTS